MLDDSALRECDESRGTRYSEGHSAHKGLLRLAESYAQFPTAVPFYEGGGPCGRLAGIET
jgi:hypothetical protein